MTLEERKQTLQNLDKQWYLACHLLYTWTKSDSINLTEFKELVACMPESPSE